MKGLTHVREQLTTARFPDMTEKKKLWNTCYSCLHVVTRSVIQSCLGKTTGKSELSGRNSLKYQWTKSESTS